MWPPIKIDRFMNKQNQIILFSIFALSILIRFSLAIVNREANDDHMETINIIIDQGRLPVKEDCWECAHPKLFYSTVAAVSKAFSISDPSQRIVTAQMVNFVLSLVMLWFMWLFIRSLDFADVQQKLITFGLLALNPALVGINAQATNDTFVITFSTAALYFARRFFAQKRYWHLTLTILFSVLAIISKTNGLITAIAIGVAILIEALAERNFSLRWGKSNLWLAGIYGLSVLTLVVLLPVSQYITNYQKYGSPLALNMTVSKQPFPYFFEKTDTFKAGILSIQDGFFTFKFLDLLVEPQTTTDNRPYPPHRTSFWTILYGRAHFIQYNQWPPSWITTSATIRWLGRIIYVMALLPSLALLIGFLVETKNLFKWIWKGIGSELKPTNAGLYVVLWTGILVFDIMIALQFRMFNNIKPIYAFPAIPALAVFIIIGWNKLDGWFLGKRAWLKFLSRASMVILAGLYAIDTIVLFLQLQFPG
jgi:hypothetical protein